MFWRLVAVLLVVSLGQARADGAPDWSFPYPALHAYLDEAYAQEFQETLRICRERPWALVGLKPVDTYVVSPAREAACLEDAVLSQLQALSDLPGRLQQVAEDYQQALQQLADNSRALAVLALPEGKYHSCDCSLTQEALTLKLYSAQLTELMRQIYLIRVEQGR